jgi:hypothetical protein
VRRSTKSLPPPPKPVKIVVPDYDKKIRAHDDLTSVHVTPTTPCQKRLNYFQLWHRKSKTVLSRF